MENKKQWVPLRLHLQNCTLPIWNIHKECQNKTPLTVHCTGLQNHQILFFLMHSAWDISPSAFQVSLIHVWAAVEQLLILTFKWPLLGHRFHYQSKCEWHLSELSGQALCRLSCISLHLSHVWKVTFATIITRDLCICNWQLPNRNTSSLGLHEPA